MGLAQCVEMQYRHLVFQQVAALCQQPFCAYLLAVSISFCFHHFIIQVHRHLYVKDAGYHGQLPFAGQWLQARHYRYCYAMFGTAVDIIVVMLIFKEHLGGHIVGSQFYFAFQVVYVGI